MLLVTSAALLLAASAPADAGAATTQPADSDPVSCQRVQEVGSLIRAKRVCMRKSEWREQRRSDRENIEKAQLGRTTKGG
jgi:hypothetical protein